MKLGTAKAAVKSAAGKLFVSEVCTPTCGYCKGYEALVQSDAFKARLAKGDAVHAEISAQSIPAKWLPAMQAHFNEFPVFAVNTVAADGTTLTPVVAPLAGRRGTKVLYATADALADALGLPK